MWLAIAATQEASRLHPQGTGGMLVDTKRRASSTLFEELVENGDVSTSRRCVTLSKDHPPRF